MILWVAAKGPGFVWAPALTPRTINTTTTEVLAIPILGAYNFPVPENTALFTSQCWNKTYSRLGVSGHFTSCPTQLFMTNLLSVAGSSTRSTRIQPRLDRMRYTYSGRSYGIGASVGLADSLAVYDEISFA